METFRVPLAQDVTPVEFILHEGAPSIGPLGVKRAGEVPNLNGAAAIACATSAGSADRRWMPAVIERTGSRGAAAPVGSERSYFLDTSGWASP